MSAGIQTDNMFKSWTSWLGAESVNEDKPEATEEQNNTGDQTEDHTQQAQGLSGEIYIQTQHDIC